MTPRVFQARVAKIAEEKRRLNYRPDGDGGWTHDEVSLGWFVLLEGSRESINFGRDRPEDLSVGDVMRVTMEKVT